jgi:hypothetical protein
MTGASRTEPPRVRPVHRDRRGHGVGHLHGRPGACTGIYEPRVAAHGPNGGSTQTAPCTRLGPSAARAGVCGGNGGHPRVRPLAGAGQAARFGDSVTYGHDARADHRDGRGMTRRRPGLRELSSGGERDLHIGIGGFALVTTFPVRQALGRRAAADASQSGTMWTSCRPLLSREGDRAREIR